MRYTLLHKWRSDMGEMMEYNRVLFIGSKKTGFDVLRVMFCLAHEKLVGVVTIDDNADTRGQLHLFREFCVNNGLGLEILKDDYRLDELIDKYSPDLCFVVGWYRIIPKEVIEKVIGGFIGVHYSLLPAHRGCAPVVWSIIAGEKRAGLSVFSLDEGMDTGDIWYQSEVDILGDDYINDVLEKLDERLVSFFQERYLEIVRGSLVPHRQSTLNISYGAKRNPEDGRINWNNPASVIYDFIRAQSKPYPGAFTVYEGDIVKIWEASIFPFVVQGAPGQVAMMDKGKGKAVIVCGDNHAIIIGDVEIKDYSIPITQLVKSLDRRFN